jgi:hypothetical protein
MLSPRGHEGKLSRDGLHRGFEPGRDRELGSLELRANAGHPWTGCGRGRAHRAGACKRAVRRLPADRRRAGVWNAHDGRAGHHSAKGANSAGLCHKPA